MKIDFSSIRAQANALAKDIVQELFLKGKFEGNEYAIGNINGDPGSSLKINIAKGIWSDFATGEAGDIIDLIAAAKQCSVVEAVGWLDKRFGKDYTPQQETKTRKEQLFSLIPVSESALALLNGLSHPRYGKPSKMWRYLSSDGEVLGIVARFEKPDGGKEVLPLIYGSLGGEVPKWHWRQRDSKRPMYGLERLKEGNLPLIVEGEKAADALYRLINQPVLTWPGGVNGWHKADFSPVFGKIIYLIADADEVGRQCMLEIADHLHENGCKVRVALVPDQQGVKGWDAADAVAQGMSKERFIQFIKPYFNEYTPGKFKLSGFSISCVLEQAQDNPGVAYTPECLDYLNELRISDRPKFVNLRKQLKRKRIGVMDLDKALSARRIENGEVGQDSDHLSLARTVVDSIGAENLLATDSHIWRWHEKGVWSPVGDRSLKQEIQHVFQSHGLPVKRATVDAVLDVLKTEVYSAAHNWNANQDTINLSNGELRWDDNDWKLEPHCREHYRTTHIPIEFDPTADCPRFRQFLQEVFIKDIDGADKAKALLEMIGYTLVSHARYERFAILVGAGSNGKSVILEVIRAMVGSENVAAVSPNQYTNKFQRAHLHTKLANIVTEIAEGAEIADAELKAITSGELITAEHKGKPPFDFQPYCTCWFGTNHMPHTRDFSDALFRRALVIPFNRTFIYGVDADPELKPILLKELPGIINLALAAFGDVIKRNGRFTEPQSCLAAKEDWRLDADQVAQFISERCEISKEAECTSETLYNSYINWAIEAGIHHKLGRKNFTTRLRRFGVELHKGTGGTRMIRGIKVSVY